MKSSPSGIIPAPPRKRVKPKCVCRGGTFAVRGFGGAKAGGWVGSPTKRKGIEGWTCDDCGRFIPCENQEALQ